MAESLNQASQIANRSAIVTTAGTVLSANVNRRFFLVQNLGTNVIFVKFGTSASSTDFDVALKAGTNADDALGGIVTSDVLVYTGIVSVAGTFPRVTATEI